MDIPGLTDTTVPRGQGPPKSHRLHKLFNIKKMMSASLL